MPNSPIHTKAVVCLAIEVLAQLRPDEDRDQNADDEGQDSTPRGPLLVRGVGLREGEQAVRRRWSCGREGELTFLNASNATSGGGLERTERK